MIMPIDYISIGKRIRELRTKKKMTQAALAERIGIEPSHMSHIERAATKVSLPTLIGIANTLEVTLDELVYGSLIKNAHISSGKVEELFSDCSSEEARQLTEFLKAAKRILRSK